ncbi:alpha/beta fold hydrolase [Streptomyces sp. NPDC047525]|uniref:thioesterase II family protein n=1 Tax=Streptomyces sp. NPDC047525 TaxID=3155264 RepID=UPI0033D1A1B9
MTGPVSPARRWLRPLNSPAHAEVRLICFPHAGAGASVYRRWLPHVPRDHELWAVQYPGREDRVAEPSPPDLSSLARHVAFALQWTADKPYVLFGHSMGAVLAHETCRHVALLGLPAPRRLVVSGSAPPASAGAACRAEAGTPPEWLDEREAPGAETTTLATQALDADIDLLSRHRPTEAPALDVPLVTLRGTDDPSVPPDAADGWQALTTGKAESVLLEGGHFTCFTHPGATVRHVVRAVEDL